MKSLLINDEYNPFDIFASLVQFTIIKYENKEKHRNYYMGRNLGKRRKVHHEFEIIIDYNGMYNKS